MSREPPGVFVVPTRHRFIFVGERVKRFGSVRILVGDRLRPCPALRRFLAFELPAIAWPARRDTAAVTLADSKSFNHRLAAEEVNHLAYRFSRPIAVRAYRRCRQHVSDTAVGDLSSAAGFGIGASDRPALPVRWVSAEDLSNWANRNDGAISVRLSSPQSTNTEPAELRAASRRTSTLPWPHCRKRSSLR